MNNLKIPDTYIFKTGERVIPGSVTLLALQEHCARYDFAKSYCKKKLVLNAASGSGYGSIILLQAAKEVFNIDISELSTAYGNKFYGKFNNHFLTMDAHTTDFPSKIFDVIVSFETIEHLPNPKKFVEECSRLLKKNGLLIVSTPNKVITSPNTAKPRNAHHFQEWEVDTFTQFMKEKFSLEKLYGQYRTVPLSNYRSDVVNNFISIILKYLPIVVIKFIKKNIIHYKNPDILKLKIPNTYKVKEAKPVDFYLDDRNKAYGIVIGIFKNK